METKPQQPKPVDYDQLYPGRFLKAGDLAGKKVTVTISAVDTEELETDKGGVKIKGLLTFQGAKKQMVLNRTNGECLKAMFGKKLSEWIGKRIILFSGRVYSQFDKAEVDCLRIWGSPDLPRETVVTIRLPKKKPQPMTMHTTAGGAAPAARAAQAADLTPPPGAVPDSFDDDMDAR